MPVSRHLSGASPISYFQGFVPPAVVNDAALSDGSGQVRAAGGAPTGTNFHSKPSGASGTAVARQSSLGAGLNTDHAACTSPIAASSATPQKVNAFVHCISSPQSGHIATPIKPVKRGSLVVYGGLRGVVTTVIRSGNRCRIAYLDFSGRQTGHIDWVAITAVAVVGA